MVIQASFFLPKKLATSFLLLGCPPNASFFFELGFFFTVHDHQGAITAANAISFFVNELPPDLLWLAPS